MLIAGYRIKEAALLLALLTLLINFGMHDFWNEYPTQTLPMRRRTSLKIWAYLLACWY